MELLLQKGIATRRGIMTSHREKAYKPIYPNLTLTKTEDLSDNSILLPIYPLMSKNEFLKIIGEIKNLTSITSQKMK